MQPTFFAFFCADAVRVHVPAAAADAAATREQASYFRPSFRIIPYTAV